MSYSNTYSHPRSTERASRQSHPASHFPSSAQHGDIGSSATLETASDSLFSLDPFDDDGAVAREDIGPRTIGRRDKSKHARDYKGKGTHAGSSGDEGSDPSEGLLEEARPAISTLPPEILARILAHLDPLSLLQSSAVSKTFAVVAKDEATWRLAFALAFRVAEDSGLTPIFRRVDIGSWKAEYSKRVELLRRWRRARSPTVICDPRVSTIHAIALSVPHHFLLSASQTFGVASRCDPFTGKVAKGFVDASGQLNGIGLVGQQQQLLAMEQRAGQEITSLALESDASRIIWGYQNGEIGMTILARQGTNPRGAIKGIRFSARGGHDGAVLDLAMPFGTARGGAHSIERSPEKLKQKQAQLGEAAEVFATAGMDGTVRLWSPKKAVPIWVAVAQHAPVVKSDQVYKRPDPVTCVELDIETGTIAASTAEGEVTLWTKIGIQSLLNLPASAFEDATSVQLSAASMQARADRERLIKNVVRIHLPALQIRGEDGGTAPTMLALDLSAPPARHDVKARLMVFCEGGTSFERLEIVQESGQEASVSSTLFTAPDQGIITAIRPDFELAAQSRSHTEVHATGQFTERSYVCAGTSQGKVLIWDWSAGAGAGEARDTVQAWCALDGHHASITALDVSAHVLVIGCSDGTIKGFCPLTGQHIRTFNDRTATRHPARMLAAGELTDEEASRYHVSQVIAGPDTLVASIGGQVLAWRAEKFRSKGGRKSAAGLRISSGKSNVGRLWDPKLQSQKEMERDVYETKEQLKKEQQDREAEYERIKYSVGGRSQLEIGDLDEQEAFEYAMMLSRDEEEVKQRRAMVSGQSAEELQDALEQVAMAESRTLSQKAGSADSNEEDEEEAEEMHAASSSQSPATSPFLTGLSSAPSRAWDILHQAGSYASPVSRNQDRWHPNNKVSIVQVPRSARMSSSHSSASASRRPSSNQTPTMMTSTTTPPKLDSPHEWPSVESSSLSRSPMQWTLGSPAVATPAHPPSLQLSRSISSPRGGPSPTLAPIKSPIGAWAGGSPSLRPVKEAPPPASSASTASALTKSKPPSLPPQTDDEIDDDLRFALELSLAEERSRRKQ